MSIKVTDYELIDHGIDGAQYFQGCGTAFTTFDNVVTGYGDTFGEALSDALDGIAECDDIDVAELEARIKADEGYTGKEWPSEPSATKVFQKHNPEAYDAETDEWDYDGCELYYYVSIRYNVAEKDQSAT